MQRQAAIGRIGHKDRSALKLIFPQWQLVTPVGGRSHAQIICPQVSPRASSLPRQALEPALKVNRFPLRLASPKMQVIGHLEDLHSQTFIRRGSSRMPLLEASVLIRCPVERVFDFLTLSDNFDKIVPLD